MNIDFRTLANESIQKLTPYQPGKPVEEVEREFGVTQSIKLASNENPLGASPQVIQAIQQAMTNVHIYPHGTYFKLNDALATSLNVKPQQLTIGNGSENILELIIKAYLHTGDSAVISQYAFLTIPILLQSYGITIKTAPAKNWGHDVNAMIDAIDAKTRVLFLVNPNNPTGTYVKKNDFHHLMRSVPRQVLVVLDEAYSEYITVKDFPEALNHLSDYPNLVIVRTFSKIYGLAALRLGYAISSPDIADILNRTRLPFNVNAMAATAGCAAIADQKHVADSIALNTEGLHQMQHGLKRLGLNYIPSIGNFITIDVSDGVSVYQKLLSHAIIVRPLSAYDMPRHIRVSIGTSEQNQQFLDAMKKIMAGDH